MRTLAELRDVQDPAWPILVDVILDAGTTSILPIDAAAGEACLVALQITAQSTLGALALNTGGLIADSGWLRILGGGTEELPSLAAANGLSADQVGGPPPLLLVALDVVGGRYAVNGGGLHGAMGEMNLWAADTLQWEPLGIGHAEFVRWAMGPGVAEFYADLRWTDWENEVEQVGLDQGISFYPPLCTAESRPLDDCSRRPVPWQELSDFLDQLAAAPNGPIRIVVDDD